MSEVAAFEKQLADARLLVERRDVILRLTGHPDFKRIILDGFCKEDCARFAQESQDPALTPAQQADALHMAQASGHLRRYLSAQITLGNHAAREIPSLEEALVEVRNDDGGE